MSNTNIALRFDTAEYYSLQEASEYLNRKYKIESITPKKLLKQISSRDINVFLHFRMDRLTSNLLRLEFDTYDSNAIPKDKNLFDLDEKELKPIIQILDGLENYASNHLINELYMGFILFRIDVDTLFNMSLNNNTEYKSLVFFFDSFIHRFGLEDAPDEPSESTCIRLYKDDKEYSINQINGITFIVHSTDDDDLREVKEKIPFLCSFIKREGSSIAQFKINYEDLIILHKDLEELETYIIENKPPVERTDRLFKKKGVSSKKLKAKLVADTHAQYVWSRDYDKKIRVSEMYELIWNYLVDTEYRDELPETKESLRSWLSVIPDYASQPGTPPKN